MKHCSLILGICLALSIVGPAPAAEGDASSEEVKVAVLEFEALGVSEMEARVLTERLRAELSRLERFRVVGRRTVEALLSKQGQEVAGYTAGQESAKLGKMVGVHRLLTGSILKVGKTYSLVLNLVDAQTGRTLKTLIEDHHGGIETLLSDAVKKAAARLAAYEGAGYLAFVGPRPGDTLDRLMLWVDGRRLEPFPKADFILISEVPEGIRTLNLEWSRPGINGRRPPYVVDVRPGMVITLECNAIRYKPTLRVSEPVEAMEIQRWRDRDWRETYPGKRYAGKNPECLSEFRLQDVLQQER